MAVIVNRVPMYLVVFSYHLGINYNWSYKILFAWLFGAYLVALSLFCQTYRWTKGGG